MDDKDIGKRLGETRRAKKLTQLQLANKADVSQGTIGNVESGARGYGKSLVKIAAALEVSTAYLLMETDFPGVPPSEEKEGKTPQLSPRQIAMLDLFDMLTKKQQDEFYRSLEDTKQANSELIEELAQRRQK